MTQPLTFNNSRVVYVYFDKDWNIAYVGEGSHSRAYNPHLQDQRDNRVNDFMQERYLEENDLRVWIKFAAAHISKRDAINLEGYLIDKYRPYLNQKGSGKGDVSREILSQADRKIGWTLLKVGFSELFRSPRQALRHARRAYTIYRSQTQRGKVIR